MSPEKEFLVCLVELQEVFVCLVELQKMFPRRLMEFVQVSL